MGEGKLRTSRKENRQLDSTEKSEPAGNKGCFRWEENKYLDITQREHVRFLSMCVCAMGEEEGRGNRGGRSNFSLAFKSS